MYIPRNLTSHTRLHQYLTNKGAFEDGGDVFNCK